MEDGSVPLPRVDSLGRRTVRVLVNSVSRNDNTREVILFS